MALSASPTRRLAAFTLLELSVVITVIALLVGGILMGRTFIRNSELSTMINEAKIYTMAFSRFQEQYNAIPGDFATATNIWPSATNGDGNTLIRAGTNNSAEMFLAFQHLYLAGYVEGSYSGAGTVAVAGTTVPRSSVNGVAYIFDHPNATDGAVSGDSYYFDGMYGHIIYAGALSVSGSPLRPAGGFMTPEEAFSLDTKFDDGSPGLGSIVTPKQSALANCASSDVAASATYATSNTGNTCMFIIKLP